MNDYIERIKAVYPELIIEDVYLNDIGQNNDVLIINNSLVFRFPKYKKGIGSLEEETKILEHIRDTISIPIPFPKYKSFELLEPGKVFTGCKRIEGNPLWNEHLVKVNKVDSIKIAKQLVTFLIEIHSISRENLHKDLKLKDSNPYEEMKELFFNIQDKLFQFINEKAQMDIIYSFESFLNNEEYFKTTLIHGDFGASNILWNPENCEIPGIIDFGNSGIGDPAYDFAGILSSYGEDFFNKCIDLYPNGSEVAKRVTFYKSTFALQEALHGLINNDTRAFENGIKEYR
ncbi:phosphotransferase family protein [Fictibacillus norfolkensis]|uniref:Aminoglycoside phosphotransferase family protein n=1 Tax=Fictibacillus norfolkensis TaxID=2762233 RepID=A0ABR8SQR5_9BACL|nr:aminoglycoside phosphotransferase family protein [Fictibacillus norfolkensis]MBD7965845.1 aminoglycoside phosphotransferase family protein [Fictibacillus norfolkensis]